MVHKYEHSLNQQTTQTFKHSGIVARARLVTRVDKHLYL